MRDPAQTPEEPRPIARFGGDEFVVLLVGGDVRGAAPARRRVLEEMRDPLIAAGRQVFLGASIGITLFPDDAEDARQLLKNGDIAMYQAKVAGKNCYRFYSRAMDQAVERRVQLEQDLRGAWERGELEPRLPADRAAWPTRAFAGAEALLRWHHPQLGMVPPSVFIEVAEQSGLIESLGRNVLATSLRGRRALAARGRSEPRSSRSTCRRANCAAASLPPMWSAMPAWPRACGRTRLHLELTETAVLGDEAQASALPFARAFGWGEGLARRLRNRLLGTQPPAPRSGRWRQDRPQLHRRPADAIRTTWR